MPDIPSLTQVQSEELERTGKIYLVTQKPNFQLLITVILFLLTVAFSAGTAMVIASSETKQHSVDTYITKEAYNRDMSRIEKKLDDIIIKLDKYAEKDHKN